MYFFALCMSYLVYDVSNIAHVQAPGDILLARSLGFEGNGCCVYPGLSLKVV